MSHQDGSATDSERGDVDYSAVNASSSKQVSSLSPSLTLFPLPPSLVSKPFDPSRHPVLDTTLSNITSSLPVIPAYSTKSAYFSWMSAQPLIVRVQLIIGSTLAVCWQFAQIMKPSDVAPLLEARIPPSPFTAARHDKIKGQLPQAIAHRGYKAKHPENTMGAFAGAAAVGAHALETDIHLTRDDVVVLSHDPTMLRCYGQNLKIVDHDWSELSSLQTIKAPHEPMPRLLDLLIYLARPEVSHLWVMLDIKLDNDAARVMEMIARTINAAPASPSKPWSQRLLLGIWSTKYLSLCQEYLSEFPILYIGFSTQIARQFLDVPNVSFSLLQKILMFPLGQRFLRDAKAADRQVFSWTVNDPKNMRWGIRHHLDGVITDDPKTFLKVCEDWDPARDSEEPPMHWSELMVTVWVNMMAALFGMFFALRHGRKIPTRASSSKGRHRILEKPILEAS